MQYSLAANLVILKNSSCHMDLVGFMQVCFQSEESGLIGTGFFEGKNQYILNEAVNHAKCWNNI